ncbi:MAG: hypothetical protein ACOX6P_09260 [Candidatus Merdivicinus sp.]|jgi:hypothetical protein
MKGMQRFLAGLTGFFAAFTLAGCGTPDTEPSTVLMHATIIYAENESILFLPSELDGTIPNVGDVYSTGLADVSVLDEEGNELQPEDLAVGQIVEIAYDGYVRESYPASITCSTMRLVGRQPEDWKNPVDIGQFFPEPDPDDPYANMPSMGVEYQTGESVSYTVTARGTSSWYENDEGICVDSVLPTHEESRERIPEIEAVEGSDSIRLIFSREPENITVSCWNWDEFAETGLETESLPVSVTDGKLTLPGQEGSYLYSVQAEWEEGDVLYYFTIRCPA